MSFNHFVKLLYEEQIIDERFEFVVQAGGVVKGISFRVLDEQGRVLDLAPYKALENSHLTIALYPEGKADHAKRKNISLPETDFINAVKVRNEYIFYILCQLVLIIYSL